MVSREGTTFIGLPVDEFAELSTKLPYIYRKRDEKGEWMVVRWRDDIHEGLKVYNTEGHIILAGCSEDKLECDVKSIYVVMHPIEEWEKFHVIK